MKRKLVLLSALAIVAIAACNKKDDEPVVTEDFNTLKQTVLTDFTNNIAIEGYKDLDAASNTLYTSLEALNANPTEANLTAARTSWKSMRTIWEQCEGFLFGPVEDNDYDPNMDTWPTDYVQMDSLLNSSNMLEVSDISAATLSLRGYHPIEYIIFGNHGDRKAADITARQRKYMMSLATDLKNTCHALYESWISGDNFGQQVKTAGSGSAKYAKKQEVYMAMVGAMTDICTEVGEGKMKEPYDAQDPKIVESPYSGNSLVDFKNNIIGLQNVYMGKYKTDGKGINDLVALKNKDLDNRIQAQLNAAINSFDQVTVTYEEAIISQRVQVGNIMTALGTLKNTLETELQPFVMQYITD